MERDKLIERIQKLLSRHQGAGATEAEAQTAMAMASRLMAEHNIAMSEVEGYEVGAEQWVEEETWSGKTRSNIAPYIVPILQKFFFVKMVWKNNDDYSQSLRIFGTAENVETAKWVFGYLKSTYASLYLRYRKEAGTTVSSVSYYQGLRDGFMEKLRNERDLLNVSAPNSSNALVLVNTKLMEEYKRRYPTFKPIRPRSTDRTSEAYSRGHQDGRNIELRRPLEGNERKGRRALG